MSITSSDYMASIMPKRPDINAPLIVVSNRLPFVLQRLPDGTLIRKNSAGGLVTAVAPVVIDCKGIWIGWSGLHDLGPDEVIPEADPNDNAPTSGLKSSQVIPVHVNKEEFEDYYNGCCNGTFWPLFHSMPDRAVFNADNWKTYCKVNEEFARCTITALKDVLKDLDAEGKTETIPVIWIHDYQLLIAATTIRQKCDEENLRCKLGFFLHIPFPSWDIMRLFPWDDQILQGILAYDFVGFHIEDYCLNFIDCCCRRLGSRVDRNNMLVEIAGRTVHVKALPIGIPFERFVQLAEKAPDFLKDKHLKVILGVDRLDYTKGLVHRIKAFERLLEKHPEYYEKVTFLQISVPSRTDVLEYKALKDEMDQLVGRINGRFSKPNWSPIRYIFGCIGQEELAALYRDSAIALVTPLRDGMNLVAKEYVACQIREPGVLILSPFAGAGGMMHEALLVNPYELDAAANVLHRALCMPKDERELRMSQLRHREQQLDVNHWMNSFLSSMGALDNDDETDPLSAKTLQLTLDDFDLYLNNYVDGVCKLSLILDYDGTLTPLTSHPDLAVMSEETKRVLERLANMPDVNIGIISGRTLENLMKMVNIEKVTYAGSHGLEILHPDGTKFVHPVPNEYAEKLRQLIKALQDEVCHDGAWIENKGVLLTFHYRETPIERREYIIERARQIFLDAGFEPHNALMAIEAKPPVKWDQGRASIHILRTMYGVDWSERVRIIYAGNEDAMLALQGIACTFRVDSSPTVITAADFRLSGPDAVLTMLKWVEKQMNKRAPKLATKSTRLLRSPAVTRKSQAKDSIHSQMSFEDDQDDQCKNKLYPRKPNQTSLAAS